MLFLCHYYFMKNELTLFLLSLQTNGFMSVAKVVEGDDVVVAGAVPFEDVPIG